MSGTSAQRGTVLPRTPAGRPGAQGGPAGPAGPAGPGGPPTAARSVAARRTRGALDAARGALQGSPGRLRLAGLVLAVVALAFAVLAGLAFSDRAAALSDARAGAAQLVRVQSLQIDLFQAHADATNAFLTGGLEPVAQRQDYESSISSASGLVAEAARAEPADAASLGRVNAALTVYTGLIEQARANNRQGFPVGSAYLRQASDLLEQTIKPSLVTVEKADEARVADAYQASGAAGRNLVLAGVVALLVLLLGQGWLALRTHRVLNAPLVAATLAVLVGLGGGALVMSLAQSRANDVRRHSYAATVALTQARIGAYEGKSNESLTLINRGNGAANETAWKADAATARRQLAAAASAGAPSDLQRLLDTWKAVHVQIRSLDDGGNWDGAVELATGTGTGSSNASFTALAKATSAALDEQSTQVSDDLGASHGLLLVAGLIVVLLGLVALGASWVGISLRLEEYR